jgi:hypothetical protein
MCSVSEAIREGDDGSRILWCTSTGVVGLFTQCTPYVLEQVYDAQGSTIERERNSNPIKVACAWIACCSQHMPSHQAALRILGLLVVAVACAARIVHLNADPSVPNWVGYVTDEGRWNETARNLALFGNSDGSSNARLHLFLAPGYQATNYVVFRLLGVDFWSARLFAAMCGIGTIVAVFFALRRHVTPFALALGLVILGWEANMLSQSRMALPEIPSVLFGLLAFLVLVSGQKTRWNAFVAALLAALAVAMKGTSIMAMAIFPVVILLVPQGDVFRDRFARALTFVAAFALLGVASLGAAVGYGVFKLDGIVFESGRLLGFLGPTTPYVVAARFFDWPELEIRNPLLLGVWFCSWIWLHRDPRACQLASALYLASGAWAAWWLLAWSGNQYLPGRYIVHWIVPTTIHIMAGLSLAGGNPHARIAAALRTRRGWTRGLSLAWLVFPSAIFVATAASGLAEIGGWGVSRLSGKIALIVALTGVLAMAARRSATQAHVVTAFLFFPVVMTLLWLAGRELGVVISFWQFQSATALAAWTGTCALTYAVCATLAGPPPSQALTGSVQITIIVTVATIFFAQGAPAVLVPTYSIRNASLDLQQKFPASARMRTLSAESLFLANQLKFRAIAPSDTSYDAIVIFEQSGFARRFLASAANLARTDGYSITVNPLYQTDADRSGPVSIGVYKPK